MNRKEIGLVAAIVLLVASISGIVYGIRQVSEVTITNREVNEKIAQNLPLTFDNVTINEAGVLFQEGRVNLCLRAEGKKLGQPFSLAASSVVAVTYDNQSGSFILVPETVKVSDLKVRGKEISKGVEDLIDKANSSKRVNNWIATLDKYVPARQLRNKIVANKAELGQKAEFKAEAMIEKSAKWLLSKSPIRPPDNLKSRTAQMALESVEVNDGKIIAHLSFWQFTKSVIACVAGCVFGLILLIMFIFCPGMLELASFF